MKKHIYYLFVLLSMVLPSGTAQAHKINDSYLRLKIDGRAIQGEWDVALYDLAATAGFMNTVGENDGPVLRDFALKHLSIAAGSAPCELHVDEVRANKEENGSSDVPFSGECPVTISTMTIDYNPFLIIDPQYGMMVNLAAGDSTYTAALSAKDPFFTFHVGQSDRWQQFKDYAREGVWHIWLGYDHILFLVSLLLSAAFVIRKRQWHPRDGFTGTFLQVLKIVTSFTIAHSITLSLVIFGAISLPSRLVESTIALSIAFAAVNNLRPTLHKRLWLLTFCFGLIHGMGFASALKELGLPDNAKWIALTGFNLGVEIGQVAIVCAVLPFVYGVRYMPVYRRVIFRGISALIIVMALLWFTQRAFGVVFLNGLFGN